MQYLGYQLYNENIAWNQVHILTIVSVVPWNIYIVVSKDLPYAAQHLSSVTQQGVMLLPQDNCEQTTILHLCGHICKYTYKIKYRHTPGCFTKIKIEYNNKILNDIWTFKWLCLIFLLEVKHKHIS